MQYVMEWPAFSPSHFMMMMTISIQEPLLLQALESLAERGAGSASEGLALLLDIFRLLYSAVGVSWVRSFRSLEALSTFLLSLVFEKVLPLTGGIGVMRRPREYAEGQWLSSRGNREVRKKSIKRSLSSMQSMEMFPGNPPPFPPS